MVKAEPHERVYLIGFDMLKVIGLHPKANKTLALVMTPIQIIPATVCLVLSVHQLFYGNNDLNSLVRNSEACALFVQVCLCLFKLFQLHVIVHVSYMF